jgi:hypothetical protein
MKTLYRVARVAVLALALGSATSVAALPQNYVSFWIIYYSDATRTTVVGETTHYCDGERVTVGSTTDYTSYYPGWCP